ncbi:MAG: hypothetical protein ABW034_00560 [Steroidobacteraceae bacterium]
MNKEFRSQFMRRGRQAHFMGSRVADMPLEDLYAVIGYLLDKGGDVIELAMRQDSPLGAPKSDPPPNDGLVEG